MTGPEHYRKAEQLLDDATAYRLEGLVDHATVATSQAQVHATLALTAATAADQATAYDGDELGRRSREWAGVA